MKTKPLRYEAMNPLHLALIPPQERLSALLRHRGIEDPKAFLNPQKEHTFSPWQLTHMEQAVETLNQAIGQQQPITILVDNDCDGQTSAAILWRYLKRTVGLEVRAITNPGKLHGITKEVLEQIHEGLLIVPDAGTNDVEGCRVLLERGVKTLILDHHQMERENPYALVVNNQDRAYPNPTLSGVGVVYQFLKAIDERFNLNEADRELPLVALGLIADMMDLGSTKPSLETRYLVLEGLKSFRNHSFLKALCEKHSHKIKPDQPITIETVAWTIAPQLNALIRMGEVEDKLRLFDAFCEKEQFFTVTKRKSKNNPFPQPITQTLMEYMADQCATFKNRQANATKKGVKAMMEQLDKETLNQKILMVDGSALEKTLTGLVANKLSQQFHRPCLVMRPKGDDEVGGSGRGYEKFPLPDFRQFCLDSGLMTFASGHADSFGFALPKGHQEAFLAYVNEQLKDVEVQDTYLVDDVWEIQYLSEKDLIEIGQHHGIFGGGIEAPLFAIKNIKVKPEAIQLVGEKRNTLKIKVKTTYEELTFLKFFSNEDEYRALLHQKETGFNRQEAGDLLELTVIGRFKVNEYQGQVSGQVEIEAIESERIKTNVWF